MDKNDDFTRVDSIAPKPSTNGKQTEKQRRRRNDKRREDFNEKTDQSHQSFRDNFRGTRVFVQNIPDRISWQDLKDHFKVAGEVVFASVSIDPRTGASKGCGVVQYESTEMANRAIKVMRDHPLEGNDLYVREDYQENRGGKELSPSGSGRGSGGEKRGATPSSTWRCADEDNLSLLSDDDAVLVKNLIKARDQARRRKNYETSDSIREDLKFKYAVHLDDRMKLWWVSTDNAVPTKVSEMKGDGRWGKQTPWRQIPTTPENDACVNPDLVQGLLKQRDIARMEKDFTTADLLLEEATTAPDGELCLRIHDESRTWRIWTAEPPRRPVSHDKYQSRSSQYQSRSSPTAARSPTTSRMNPAEQCISLVEKHDPNKLDEVKTLLKKFPGREYNILKKLKQNYGV